MELIILVLLVALALRYGLLGQRARGVVGRAMAPALMLGGIGFAAGFFGPIIFTPEANQGPLLGIFITGPLGFLLGLVFGIVRELRRPEGAEDP